MYDFSKILLSQGSEISRGLIKTNCEIQIQNKQYFLTFPIVFGVLRFLDDDVFHFADPNLSFRKEFYIN